MSGFKRTIHWRYEQPESLLLNLFASRVEWALNMNAREFSFLRRHLRITQFHGGFLAWLARDRAVIAWLWMSKGIPSVDLISKWKSYAHQSLEWWPIPKQVRKCFNFPASNLAHEKFEFCSRHKSVINSRTDPCSCDFHRDCNYPAAGMPPLLNITKQANWEVNCTFQRNKGHTFYFSASFSHGGSSETLYQLIPGAMSLPKPIANSVWGPGDIIPVIIRVPTAYNSQGNRK